jgi:hypothetical protein
VLALKVASKAFDGEYNSTCNAVSPLLSLALVTLLGVREIAVPKLVGARVLDGVDPITTLDPLVAV